MTKQARANTHSVPGIGGASSDERSPDGQRALRLHAGIATVAVVLCAFVAAVFVWLGSVPLAVAFGVIGLLSLGALVWAVARRRRGGEDTGPTGTAAP